MLCIGAEHSLRNAPSEGDGGRLKGSRQKSEIIELSNSSWDSILKKLDDELAKKRELRSPFVSQNLEAVAESTVLLRSVKIAWRNPTMHVENIYDKEKALDVFNAAKGFMRSLASFVSE